LSILTIYKSSAGSGKTYTLAANWLNMLFRNEKAYRGILAVTFTNKAAAEMKGRILETLYKLHIADESTRDLTSLLSGNTGLPPEEIHKKAGRILFRVLNDYSAFHVETIDKFFQWVIRSFARETGLQAGYNLELNNKRILSEAIDLLMTTIDHDEKLKLWLVRFAEEKITEGKDWNFNQELLLFGEEIFKEKFREITGNMDALLTQKEKISDYPAELYRVIKGFEDYMAGKGESALEAIIAVNLETDDFNHKNAGVAGYFKKIADGTDFDPKTRVRKVLYGEEDWVSKSSPKKEIIEKLVDEHLHQVLKSVVDYYDANSQAYYTARTILRYIYSFGILTDIYLKIREITFEKNLFLLADAAVFLKRIIANNDTPFIYEKAGNSFNHFMLDEFQDTSGYQWGNFYPLILNSLAANHESLMVGDVKQSVYRWRNSDWEILASQAEKRFREFNLKIMPLDTNWRSFYSIVSFNNSLFGKISKKLEALIETDLEASEEEEFVTRWKETVRQIYGSTSQKVSEKNINCMGYVEMRFSDISKEEYYRNVNSGLPLLIEDIQSRGYKPGDIAILVRKSSQGRDVASALMQYAAGRDEAYMFNVISNDSLFIESHPSVRFIISLLSYLNNPDDAVNVAFIHHEYLEYLSGGEDHKNDKDRMFNDAGNGLSPDLHQTFRSFRDDLGKIRHLPLFELVEDIIVRFGLNLQPDNIAFIQALQDIILNFVNDESSDVGAFLNWWDQNRANQTLNVSEAQDAIRILTIHKAKGLQFPVVIVPFCDWSVDAEPGTTNFLWCRNTVKPFSMMEYVPVKYTKELLNTYFRQDYLNEKFHNYIDNINLVYVALTRPVEELYVFAGCAGKSSVGSLIFNAIDSSDDTNNKPDYPFADLNLTKEDSEWKVTAGEKGRSAGKTKATVPEFIGEYPLTDNRAKLSLNLRNALLELTEKDYGRKIGYGTVMHEILSRIETHNDIEDSVRKACLYGKVPGGEMENIVGFLVARLNDPRASEWFDGTWEVKKEREICSAGKSLYRPDRVMIKNNNIVVVDYKFGEEKDKRYQKQVLRYIEILKKMGSFDVEGWLWFFYDNSLIEVK